MLFLVTWTSECSSKAHPTSCSEHFRLNRNSQKIPRLFLLPNWIISKFKSETIECTTVLHCDIMWTAHYTACFSEWIPISWTKWSAQISIFSVWIFGEMAKDYIQALISHSFEMLSWIEKYCRHVCTLNGPISVVQHMTLRVDRFCHHDALTHLLQLFPAKPLLWCYFSTAHEETIWSEWESSYTRSVSIVEGYVTFYRAYINLVGREWAQLWSEHVHTGLCNCLIRSQK